MTQTILAEDIAVVGAVEESSLVYLDYQATTPIDSDVLNQMLPYLTHRFGNASSSTHLAGARALDAVQQARAHVADAIGAHTSEIVFTSGATESNNLAI